MHGRSIRDISDKTLEIMSTDCMLPMIPRLEIVEAGNNRILEVVTVIFVRERVELEFLGKFEVLTIEGGSR